MPRKAKLTQKQWLEVMSRVSPLGTEPIRSVAAEFGISHQAISQKINKAKGHSSNPKIKQLAQKIADTREELSKLPVIARAQVLTLAEQLQSVTASLASAAVHSSRTSERLAKLADLKSAKVSEHSPQEEFEAALRDTSALTRVSNDAAVIPLALIKANQDCTKPQADLSKVEIPDDPQEAARVYQQLMLGKL